MNSSRFDQRSLAEQKLRISRVSYPAGCSGLLLVYWAVDQRAGAGFVLVAVWLSWTITTTSLSTSSTARSYVS